MNKTTSMVRNTGCFTKTILSYKIQNGRGTKRKISTKTTPQSKKKHANTDYPRQQLQEIEDFNKQQQIHRGFPHDSERKIPQPFPQTKRAGGRIGGCNEVRISQVLPGGRLVSGWLGGTHEHEHHRFVVWIGQSKI